MGTNFTLTLDTTAPATPAIVIDGGNAYATSQSVTAGVTTGDGTTAGYQMKIWGDVDTAADANVQATEGASSWIAFSATKAITLSSGDGTKTLHMKLRDDVWNETSEVTDTITLDTSLPVPTVSVGPDVSKVSKISGKRVASFSFQSDAAFEEYKVKVVPSTGSLHTAGTAIPTTNGSTNMAGSAGGYPATTNVDSTIDGRDLELASSGDGAKIVKVFVKDAAGNWSL
jgi:hypothetical protein